MIRYHGPDRRAPSECAGTGCPSVDRLQDHIDAVLESHRAHVDRQFAELLAKVDPMYDYYTAGKIGARIVRWLLGIAAGLGTIWALMWPKK
jgi:hypothetical protein